MKKQAALVISGVLLAMVMWAGRAQAQCPTGYSVYANPNGTIRVVPNNPIPGLTPLTVQDVTNPGIYSVPGGPSSQLKVDLTANVASGDALAIVAGGATCPFVGTAVAQTPPVEQSCSTPTATSIASFAGTLAGSAFWNSLSKLAAAFISGTSSTVYEMNLDGTGQTLLPPPANPVIGLAADGLGALYNLDVNNNVNSLNSTSGIWVQVANVPGATAISGNPTGGVFVGGGGTLPTSTAFVVSMSPTGAITSVWNGAPGDSVGALASNSFFLFIAPKLGAGEIFAVAATGNQATVSAPGGELTPPVSISAGNSADKFFALYPDGKAFERGVDGSAVQDNLPAEAVPPVALVPATAGKIIAIYQTPTGATINVVTGATSTGNPAVDLSQTPSVNPGGRFALGSFNATTGFVVDTSTFSSNGTFPAGSATPELAVGWGSSSNGTMWANSTLTGFATLNVSDPLAYGTIGLVPGPVASGFGAGLRFTPNNNGYYFLNVVARGGDFQGTSSSFAINLNTSTGTSPLFTVPITGYGPSSDASVFQELQGGSACGQVTIDMFDEPLNNNRTVQADTKMAPLGNATNLFPDALNFGGSPVGSPLTQTFTVYNPSTTYSETVDFGLFESVASDFTIPAATNGCTSLISPGGSCTAQAQFRPSALGPRDARMGALFNYPGATLPGTYGTIKFIGVGETNTSTKLTVTPSSSFPFGTIVTNTANVTSLSGTNAVNDGQVLFYDGGILQCATPVASGQASCQPPTPNAGQHVYIAVYDPITQSGVSSDSTTRTVTAATPILSLTPTTVSYGAPVSNAFNATAVAPGSTAIVPGTYSYEVNGNVTSASQLYGPGTYTLTVIFTPNDGIDYTTATTSTTFTVTKATPTIPVTSSMDPSPAGTSVTLTATLPSTATGTVTFLDGATTLGSATVSSGVASITTNLLSVGNNSITATYSGDGNYASVTSTPFTQVVTAPVTGLVPSPGSLTFPAELLNTSSAPLAFAVTNNTGAPLTGLTGTIFGPFRRVPGGSNCASSLKVNASCSEYIEYLPTSLGLQTGTFTISNKSGILVTVPLTGTAVAPLIVVNPVTLSLPDTVRGTSSTGTVSISNTGTAPLTLFSIAITEESPFTETNNCGASLTAGGGCAITITFAPSRGTALGQKIATLTISDNSGGIKSKQTVTLTGTATR